MKFKRLKINNFLAIGQVELELNDLGLILIQGVNEDEPSASSNGSGKSSLGDAMSWVLFGKTARGLSADAVVNKTIGKNTCVELEVEDDNQTYLIRRYRKHEAESNRLTLHQVLSDGSEQDLTKGTDKLTQEDIERLLGCSYEVFCVAVYAGQERFPDLPGMTDKTLKVLIEEAAGVERLQRAYEVARNKLNQTKTQYELREVEWLRLQEQFQIHQRRRVELQQQIREWDQQQTKQRRLWRDEAEAKRKEAERLQSSVDPQQMSQIIVTLESIHNKLSNSKDQSRERQLEQEVTQAAVALTAAQQQIASVRQQLDRCRHEAQHLERKVGTSCHECGKTYATEDLDVARQALHRKIADMQQSLEPLSQSVSQLEQQHQLAQLSLDQYRQSLPDVSKLIDAQRRLQSKLDEIRTVQHAVKSLLSDSERLEQQALATYYNPLESALDGLQRDLEGVEQSLQSVSQHRQQLEEDLLLVQQAVEVFAPAGVRAQILDTVTPFLNERTAMYLGTLSDGNILATWQTLTRNGKGELKEKFTIDVTSTTGGLDFKSLSGGEKRKVRLATAMALADLVSSRATKPLDVLFCDEIDDSVDSSGLERLMVVLEQKAQERGTTIVVSHNDLSHWISATLTIRKKNGLAELI